MAVKTLFSADEFITILTHYNLGAYRSSQPFVTGNVQTNYALQTENGKFVFRYYENRGKESVLFEAHLLQYLKDRGYPCPALIKNKRGGYAGLSQGKPYALFEFIDGQATEHPTEEQKQQLIHKVGELNVLTRNYRPRYKKYRWNYNPGLCIELAQRATQEIGDQNARDKLAWYTGMLSNLQLPQALPKGVCHCDFHFSNVLYKDGQFAALIDFDDANYTYLTYDLITLINPFISTFDWDTWQQFGPEENVFDFREAREVIREYTKVRPLETVEKKHLFDVYLLSIFIDCLWYYPRGDAADFYEKRKIEYLNRLGRDKFYAELFTK